jgi:hypothetical protein
MNQLKHLNAWETIQGRRSAILKDASRPPHVSEQGVAAPATIPDPVFVSWPPSAGINTTHDDRPINFEAMSAIANIIKNIKLEPTAIDERFADGEKIVQLCKQIIKANGLELNCPFTGISTKSNAFLIYPCSPWSTPIYAYRFETDRLYFVIVHGFTQCRVIGVYAPLDSICYHFSSEEVAQRQITSLNSFVANNLERICDILSSDNRVGMPIAVIHSAHFAHNMWNELSAIYELRNEHNVQIHILHEPNGPLETIYPEMKSTLVRYPSVSVNEFYLQCSAAGAVALPIGRTRIPSDVARSILCSATAAHQEDVILSTELKATHSISLWSSIRVGNRACLNQVEAITSATSSLQKLHGRVLLILDGFTSAWGRSPTGSVVSEEIEVANAIFAQLGDGVTVVCLVGAKLRQAYVWGSAADLYLTHHGSIQHKIGWFHQIPGVCHAPEQALDLSKIPAVNARELGIFPVYVYGPVTTHREPTTKDWRQDLHDYVISVEVVTSEICKAALLIIPRDVAYEVGKKTITFVAQNGAARVNAEAILKKAGSAWQSGDWNNALRYFSEGLETDPNYGRAFERLLSFLALSYRGHVHEKYGSRVAFLSLILAYEIDHRNAWIVQQLEDIRASPSGTNGPVFDAVWEAVRRD